MRDVNLPIYYKNNTNIILVNIMAATSQDRGKGTLKKLRNASNFLYNMAENPLKTKSCFFFLFIKV